MLRCVVTDALGNPQAVKLTGGQIHEVTQAEALAAQVKVGAVRTNKGLEAHGFIEGLRVRKVAAMIPPKANRKRNPVERLFNIIRHLRGATTRYEQPARNFLTCLTLVCALACLE